MAKFRTWIQLLFTLATNSYISGYQNGTIYKGNAKRFCLPGLNCYSCPGAIASCPIGALQSAVGTDFGKIPLYISGFFLFFGALTGRFICGFLCPFGLVQDLLHKIPFVRKIKTFKGDKALRIVKFIILAVFVILLPLFAASLSGISPPYFCKLICPAGTLEAGLPLALLNSGIASTLGFLFAWKFTILVIALILSVIIFRPFCKYICPLGAIYGLFNKIAFMHLSIDEETCISCGKCAAVCPMGCDPVANPDDIECIRCGKCSLACPVNAINLTSLKSNKKCTLCSKTTTDAKA